MLSTVTEVLKMTQLLSEDCYLHVTINLEREVYKRASTTQLITDANTGAMVLPLPVPHDRRVSRRVNRRRAWVKFIRGQGGTAPPHEA